MAETFIPQRPGSKRRGVVAGFTRASGVAASTVEVEVGNFPEGGHAFLDDVALPMLPGPHGTRLSWTVRQGGMFRVTSADGADVREASLADLAPSTVAVGLDWTTMARVPAAAAPSPVVLRVGVLGVGVGGATVRPAIDFAMGGGFAIGGAGSTDGAAGFAITGIPSTATGIDVRIDGQNASGALVNGVWTANVAPIAGHSYMAQVRLRSGAGLTAPLGAPVEFRVDMPATGGFSVPFSSFRPLAGGAATGLATLTLTGGRPGWTYALITQPTPTDPALLAVMMAATGGTFTSASATVAVAAPMPSLIAGNYTVLVATDGGVPRMPFPVTLVSGANTKDVSGAATTITFTGGRQGWTVTMGGVSPSFPATGDMGPFPVPAGGYDIVVDDHVRPPVTGRFTVVAGQGNPFDVRTAFTAAATARVIVNGPSTWRVGLGVAGGEGRDVGYNYIGTTGAARMDVAPGRYQFRVDTDMGTGRSDVIDVPPEGRLIDARTFVAAGTPTSQPAPGTLSVSGAQAGWKVKWAPIATPNAWSEPRELTAATGGPWSVPTGRYALSVTRADDTEARGSFAILNDAVTEDLSRYFPAPGASGGITVTGLAGWRFSLTPTTPAGSPAVFTTRIDPAADAPLGSVRTVAYSAGTPGTSYALMVDDGAGHTETRTVVIPASGLPVDLREYLASALRPTQGPVLSPPVPTNGTLVLTGTPGPGSVNVGGIYTWTMDGTARPMEFSLPAGSYSILLRPTIASGSVPAAEQRRGPVVITAGVRTEVGFGSLPAINAITDGTSTDRPPMTNVDLVQNYVGPVLDRPAWAPVTASPGDLLRGPDGTSYRVMVATPPAVGVVLVQLKADGTPVTAPPVTAAEEGMSVVKKGAIVVGIVGLGVAARYWWMHRATGAKSVKNPARRH